jgi:PPM family protein phosphatase
MKFITRLFQKSLGTPPDRAATAPLDPQITPGIELRRHVVVGAAHSSGLERKSDDDALLIISGSADGHEGMVDFGLFCVADGLGGYEHGQLASAISVRTVAHKLTREVFLRLLESEPNEEEEDDLESLVRSAFTEANDLIQDRADGGATTLTIALLLGEYMMIGHVGDTRAYVINRDGIEVLTRDQSLVQKLIETGTITEEEAAESPHRNVLWNAMGRTEQLQVDVFSHSVENDSYLLLCSDGLWGEVEEREIHRLVLNFEHPQAACNALVQAATEAGGSDNITAVLLQFPSRQHL